MNTLELIKDSCLFGGTIPNERTEEVRTFLDNLEKQLTIPVVVKSFCDCIAFCRKSENPNVDNCKQQVFPNCYSNMFYNECIWLGVFPKEQKRNQII